MFWIVRHVISSILLPYSVHSAAHLSVLVWQWCRCAAWPSSLAGRSNTGRTTILAPPTPRSTVQRETWPDLLFFTLMLMRLCVTFTAGCSPPLSRFLRRKAWRDSTCKPSFFFFFKFHHHLTLSNPLHDLWPFPSPVPAAAWFLTCWARFSSCGAATCWLTSSTRTPWTRT